MNFDELVNRINELAHKAKAEGLTEEETQERAHLRQEYLAQYRRGLQQVLDSTYVVDEKDNKRKLEKRRLN